MYVYYNILMESISMFGKHKGYGPSVGIHGLRDSESIYSPIPMPFVFLSNTFKSCKL